MPTTITKKLWGATNVQDTWIYSSSPNNNYGASTSLYFGGATSNAKPLTRIDTSLIPTDVTLTACRIYFTQGEVGRTLVAYRVADANTWVEGTKAGATAGTGETCWNKVAYNTQNWAGSVGCSTSGTDYDAVGSTPTTIVSGYNYISLPIGWLNDWRSGARVNNGVVLIEPTPPGGFPLINSSDAQSNGLYWEIDYELPANQSIVTVTSTNIIDTYLSAAQVNYNYGTSTLVETGKSDARTGLWKIDTASIPAGNITDVTLYLTVASAIAWKSHSAYAVAATNDWIEGTKTGGTAAAGEPTWNYLKYNTVNWAGSVGCATSGTR